MFRSSKYRRCSSRSRSRSRDSRSRRSESDSDYDEDDECPPAYTSAVEWKRSGCSTNNHLHLFESGELYDCTFKVGNQRQLGTSSEKEFKCHKLVLSLASSVFKAMLFGDGAESRKNRDEPIQLNDVAVEAFECTMRFVYGEEIEFKNVKFAMEVYKFAYEMKICGVTQALDYFLTRKITPSTVLEVYKLFKSIQNAVGLRTCMAMIIDKTEQVLASEFWPSASEEIVRDVLNMDNLNAPELAVVRALVKWGKAQEMPLGGQQLRIKLMPLLKLIRFKGIHLADFAHLSINELNDVLSVEEKFAIQTAIILKNWTLMPAHFTPLKEPRSGVERNARNCYYD